MALGSLIGAAYVSVSADTKPAEKAIKSLGALGAQALQLAMLPTATVLAAAIGGIATAFIGAGVAAGAFAAAVKPQLTSVTNASKQYAQVQAAQTKAELASSQARALATKSGVAYENALAKATAAHQHAQQLALSGSKDYRAAQKQAQADTLKAQLLAGQGGKAYAAALGQAKTANQAAAQAQAVYNQTLAGMPPATAATAVAYSKLTDAVQKWSDSLAPKTMPIFTLGIEKIQGLLPKLTPIVSQASDVIMSFLENLGAGTAGKVFSKFGTDISALSTGSLQNFLTIAKNIAVGLAGILDTFTPLASTMTGGLATLTAKFAEWGATAGSTSGVMAFFATAKKDAPVVAASLERIATAATHVGGGLGDLTGIGLKVAEALSSILAALPVPVLNQVVNAIVAVNVAMKLYAIYTSIAAAATWAFSTANGASRFQMSLMYIQMTLIWVQLRLQALWTGITTAATWLWNTSLIASLVSLVTSVATMIARNVALAATATATAIATAATWLWTAAMAPAIAALWAMTAALLASPITWIVLGIVALIAIIVIIATKTTWFQTIWKYVWMGIKDTAEFVWGAIKATWSALETAANWLWTGVLRPVFKFIVDYWLFVAGAILQGAVTMFGWVPGIGGKLKSAQKAFQSFADSVNKSLSGIQPKTVPVTVSFNGVPEGQITGHTYTSTTGFSYADGGLVRGPGSGTSDSVPIRASNGEFVVNAKSTQAFLPQLTAINSRFASGGMVGFNRAVQGDMALASRIDIANEVKRLASSYAHAYNEAGPTIQGLAWARTQVGKPYQWGGNGDPSWDCSGFLSAIESVMRGETAHRRWATGAFSGSSAPPGWVLNGKSRFMIGITNAGVGHTAGTLDGTNVEMSTVGARVGPSARGYTDPMFPARYGFAPAASGTFDAGGWLMPGRTLAYNGTGRPERVLGPGQGGGTGGVLNLTVVNQGVIGSQRETMNWLVASLQEAKRLGRLRGLVGP